MKVFICLLLMVQTLSGDLVRNFQRVYAYPHLGDFPVSERITFEKDLGTLLNEGLVDEKFADEERRRFRQNYLRIYDPVLLFSETHDTNLFTDVFGFCLSNRDYELFRRFEGIAKKVSAGVMPENVDSGLAWVELSERDEPGYGIFPTGIRKIFFVFPHINPRIDSPLKNQTVEWMENASRPNSITVKGKNGSELFRRDDIFSCCGLWSPSGMRLALSFERGQHVPDTTRDNPFGRFSEYGGKGKSELLILEKDGTARTIPPPPIPGWADFPSDNIIPHRWETEDRLLVFAFWKCKVQANGIETGEARVSQASPLKLKRMLLAVDGKPSPRWELAPEKKGLNE